MKSWYLGVDGGNTKTHYALFDQEGTLHRLLHRGTASHEALPERYEGARKELEISLRILLEPLGLTTSDLAYSGLGLAGVDTAAQHQNMTAILESLGLNGFRLVNDAFLGIKAGTNSGFGVCSINGTGTVTAGISPSGKSVQIGGLGMFSGDEAGGVYLAQCVLRAIYDENYRCGHPTGLTSLLLQNLKLDSVRRLFALQVEGKIPVLETAATAFEAASRGDQVAIAILEKMGTTTAESALGAIRLLDFPGDDLIEIVMAGSVYVKGADPTLNEAFKRRVRKTLGERGLFRLLKAPPVAGAVLWAMEDGGISIDAALRERVLSSLQDSPTEHALA